MPTVPRFRKADKVLMAKDDRSIFVALPEMVKAEMASIQTSLFAFVTNIL